MLNKKSILAKTAIPFLVLALVLGVSRFAKADPPPTAQGVVTPKVCCKNGVKTGNSNDCISGSGGCVDHKCNKDEIESNSCPQP